LGNLDFDFNNFTTEQSEESLKSLINTLVSCKEALGMTSEEA
jgi:hypothetical protein